MLTTDSYTVVQETNHFRIMRGWLFQDTWLELADGTVELWALPLHPFGRNR